MISRRSFVTGAAASFAGLLPRASAAASAVAVVGARVYVDGRTAVEDATLVARQGVVVGVAKGATPPADAVVVDGRGKVVTAGLVDGYTSLGLVEMEGVESTVEGTVRGPLHASYRASDAFHPRSPLVAVARGGGVTSVVAAPRGGIVAGTSVWASLDGREPEGPTAMHVTLGEDSMGTAGGSRGRALEILREALDDAATFEKRRDAFERRQTRDFVASRLDLEALVPVLRGTLPLAATVHRAADIRAFLRLLTERRLRGIVVGGTEAWALADELARAGVPVIMNPLHNLPSSFDRLLVRNDAATVLIRAGVPVAFTTGSLGEPWSIRMLHQCAGVAVAWGLPWADALSAVTETPARIFGQKQRGRLVSGQAADFVVWSGDPLEVQARPSAVYIRGEDVGVRSRQSLLLDRYRKVTR